MLKGKRFNSGFRTPSASRPNDAQNFMKTATVNPSRRSFLAFLFKAPLIPAAVLATRKLAQALPAPPRQVLLNDFKIAGFQYYDGPKPLGELASGAQLTLRAQPANPHDFFAVEIFHGQAKLGYVPRYCNRHLSRMLQEGVPLACRADAIAPKAAPWDAVAVNVYIHQPESEAGLPYPRGTAIP